MIWVESGVMKEIKQLNGSEQHFIKSDRLNLFLEIIPAVSFGTFKSACWVTFMGP